jgi:hypothetical protein
VSYVDPESPTDFLGQTISTSIKPKVGDKKKIKGRHYEIESIVEFPPETKIRKMKDSEMQITTQAFHVRLKPQSYPRLRAIRG